MGSSINDEHILSALLQSDDELVGEDSDSEISDHVSEDDVQSDTEEAFIDEVHEVQPTSSGSEILDEQNVIEQPGSSLASNRTLTLPQRTIRGKNKHCWSTSKSTRRSRVSALNIVRSQRGPTRMCRNIYDPLLCFKLFFTDEIISEIVKWTNAEISLKRRESMTGATFRDTNEDEIYAFFGILVMTAVRKDNHMSTDDLFDRSLSMVYVSVMSRDRFDFLIRCLRMDDKSIRPTLRENDVFTPVRKIWDLFIHQCIQNYTPGAHLTIDEQLLGFRGRCPFRMYIPNKPSKYGIKILMMCDSGTKYMINGMPYLGRGTQTNGVPLGEYYVKELSKPVHGSCRNITCDNWFTSIPLAKNLLQEPYKLTIVGTVRSNKREIPEVLKNSRSRPVGTSMFCFDGPLTLVSYKPKPAKMVYLLSSCDEDASINESTGKPQMVMYYNQTKGGVDTLDQMCSVMTCSRKTNRWPMALLYGMINIACINSFIIYSHNVSSKGEKVQSRKNFMRNLYMSLTSSFMRKRLEAPTLKRYLRDNISNILPNEVPGTSDDSTEEPVTKKRTYCTYCPSKIRRKANASCKKCKKVICREHNIDMCQSCF
uniref:Transposase n=1 Tax=Macdunnoughia crassisigna TaxID=502028 RepID=B1P5D5_9NEOP|nr:transposase [Macdunnoughia crassisigna]